MSVTDETPDLKLNITFVLKASYAIDAEGQLNLLEAIRRVRAGEDGPDGVPYPNAFKIAVAEVVDGSDDAEAIRTVLCQVSSFVLADQLPLNLPPFLNINVKSVEYGDSLVREPNIAPLIVHKGDRNKIQ